MTTLSAMPVTGVLSASHREPLAQLVQPSAGRVVQPTSQPILPSAVEQARPAEKVLAGFLKQISTDAARKTRLVGPPPAFEVTLLQQIRETGLDPEPPDLPLVDAGGQTTVDQAPIEADPGSGQAPPDGRSFAFYQQISSLSVAEAASAQPRVVDLSL